MSRIAGIALGIYEKALPSAGDWDERLAAARLAGFDFVEMSLDPTPERLARLEWTPARRREVRHMLEDAGLPIQTMCLSATREYPLGTGDRARRAQALRILRGAVDLAADLGIRIIQVGGHDTLPGEPSDRSSQARYVEAIQQMVVWASQRGVLLGLENQDYGYVNSPTAAISVIHAVGSPYLGLYLDVGNLIVNRLDALAEIAHARGHLVGVHVKDARPDTPRRVSFGDGDVPFIEAFTQLRAMGYTGVMMIEMWNDDRPDSVEIAAAARAWVETRLAEAGWAETSD